MKNKSVPTNVEDAVNAETRRTGTDGPKMRVVECDYCYKYRARAMIPQDTVVSSDTEDADGKVDATCYACGEEFHVSFRSD